MIFQNLMIQWNPTFVLIDINKLILLYISLFLHIFRIASDLRKIIRLNTFSEHARPLILSQEEVLTELELIKTISVLRDLSCAICPANFTVNLSTGALETLFTIDIVCVTTNCRVKDEWKRSWYKDNSVTKNLFRIYFFERVRDSILAESETAWELGGMEVLRDKSHALPVLSLHRVMG